MKSVNIQTASPDEVYEFVQDFLCDSQIANHSERVCRICEEIVEELQSEINYDIQKEKLYKAAYLHDIGKITGKSDRHHKTSKKLIQHLGKKYGCDVEYIGQLKSMVQAHRGKFKPDADVAIEAAVLRMADKIDKYTKNKKYKRADRSFKKSLKKIKRYFKINGDKRFKPLKEACKTIRGLTKLERLLK